MFPGRATSIIAVYIVCMCSLLCEDIIPQNSLHSYIRYVHDLEILLLRLPHNNDHKITYQLSQNPYSFFKEYY